ncbi:ribonuclease D [Luteimonas suaedae]|uniref:ribonuclease D n=1 Tax=Luteimonas suaedae TaxID=2605430 RepID=UPI0011EE0149|nr:ribonuclease D [Luteimonas suaedae]
MPVNAPQWIADPAALNARLSTHPARVGLDTEFIRERTYWPRLALVQVAIDDDILLIDPLAPGIAEALRPLLTDPAVLKIMHSAGEDLIAFGHACGAVPAPLFDTQIAAALGGIAAGVGYQRLVQELTGVALAKGETRSDWLQRPLSPAQLEYAADDVRHLFAMHDTLAERLETLDRRDWFDEDCRRLLAVAADEPERWPHLALRTAQFLDEAARHRLLRLLRWRDRWARERDRPRSWVLDNELAVLLARDPPPDQAGVQRVLDSHPKASRKLAEPMWLALQTPLPDEHEAPLPSDDVDRKALRSLQDTVAARSAELGLPDGVLASRRWLERLLQTGDWPPALSGWRRRELEPALLPLLSTAADLQTADDAG